MSKPSRSSAAMPSRDELLMKAYLKQLIEANEVVLPNYEKLARALNMPTTNATSTKWCRFIQKLKKEIADTPPADGPPIPYRRNPTPRSTKKRKAGDTEAEDKDSDGVKKVKTGMGGDSGDTKAEVKDSDGVKKVETKIGAGAGGEV